MKRLNPHLARALKVLKEVEGREWWKLLLDSADPTNEAGEALKILRVAAAYKQFESLYPDAKLEVKQEAYKVLRIAFDGRRFPPRRWLSKAQFGQLLDLHLHYM